MLAAFLDVNRLKFDLLLDLTYSKLFYISCNQYILAFLIIKHT